MKSVLNMVVLGLTLLVAPVSAYAERLDVLDGEGTIVLGGKNIRIGETEEEDMCLVYWETLPSTGGIPNTLKIMPDDNAIANIEGVDYAFFCILDEEAEGEEDRTFVDIYILGQ